MKVAVIRRPEYFVLFEEFEGRTFVHCDVWLWRPSIRRRLVVEWEALVALHGGPLFAIHEGDPKHAKWLKIFGFQYDVRARCRDGKTRDIYVRT